MGHCILQVCVQIELELRVAKCRDNPRGFFEQCFSLLLKQIFGYNTSSSWLSACTKASSSFYLKVHLKVVAIASKLFLQGGLETDAKALVALLAPGGKLMAAMQSADAEGLIKFEFPQERLPTHTQQLMRLEAGRCAPYCCSCCLCHM